MQLCLINDDVLLLFDKPDDIGERAGALSVPQHQTERGLERHCPVLERIKLRTLNALGSRNFDNGPDSKVVSTVSLHAEHLNAFIMPTAQVLLHRAVGAISV